MPKNKFDGVIEAVRYKEGEIAFVRAYERRGMTFSDWVLLDRASLLERLENGRRFVVGQREDLLASTFKVGKPVKLIKANGRAILTTREGQTRDDLEAPVF